MRRELTVLMAAMVTVCGLAGCGGKTPAASTAAPAETAAAAKGADSDWYMEALTDAALKEKYPFHCFADVNGDGVPVLFMSSTEDSFIGDEDRACMIIYDSGSPKIVKEIGGNGGERFYCDPEEHTVTWFSRMSGEGHFEVYRAADGKLELLTKADSYGPHHYPEKDSADHLFFQDGKEISEKDSDALWEKYTSESNEISYTE